MNLFTNVPLVLALVSSSALLARPALSGEAQPAAGRVDLSGRWVYNVELSDDAREKMREGMEKRGPGGGEAGGRAGSGGRRGRRRNGRPWWRWGRPRRDGRAAGRGRQATTRARRCARSWSRPRSC